MVDRETIIELLKEWGRWQHTAKNPSQAYVLSQHDTPLQKKRDVKPIYTDPTAENLDKLMLKYLPKEYILILGLQYVDLKINIVAADILHISKSTLIHKRNEAIAMLQGIYTVLESKAA